MVDVVDPAGIVRSQAIESHDRRLRLTLNGAENRRTLGRPLHRRKLRLRRAASGLRHRRHLRHRGSRLEAHGFEPLPISPNYYDDVEARFGLDPGSRRPAARRRTSSTTATSTGEFFQLYAPTFGEGFIFEIVERRGGYAGYGAANAPFRIAAQKRLMQKLGKARPAALEREAG